MSKEEVGDFIKKDLGIDLKDWQRYFVEALIEQHRRWRNPTEAEREFDRQRDKERDQRIQAIIEGRKDPLYASVRPSKPLWRESRTPLNRRERRLAKRQNRKEV